MPGDTHDLPDWPRPVVAWSIESPDPDRLRTFYAELFHWDIGEGPIALIGAGVGGPEPGPVGVLRGGEEPRVTLFVQVRSLRETLDRAAELGGTITAEPFDLPGQPTLAAITDPDGSPVMLVQQ